MKELISKYRKSCIAWAVVCLIIGSLLSAFELRDYLPIGAVQDLDSISPDEIKEGRGKVTVSYIYDYFSYWTDDYGKEVIRDYFVLAGNDDNAAYIGCELHGSKNERAYNIMQEIWTIQESGSEDLSSVDYFTIKGNVKKIEGDDLKYYNDYLDEMAEYFEMSQAEVEEWFKPYVLVQPQVGDGDFTAYLATFFGLALILGAIALIGKAIFADPLKDMRSYAKTTGNEELTMSYIESFYNMTPDRYGIRVNDKYFILTGTGKPKFCETKNIIWFYKYVVTRKSYFITVGHDYYVRIQLANGKMLQVASKNEAGIGEMLDYLMKMIPDAIVGFSDELNRMYRNNRQQMISEVSRRREQRMGSADPGTLGTEPVSYSNDI